MWCLCSVWLGLTGSKWEPINLTPEAVADALVNRLATSALAAHRTT